MAVLKMKSVLLSSSVSGQLVGTAPTALLMWSPSSTSTCSHRSVSAAGPLSLSSSHNPIRLKQLGRVEESGSSRGSCCKGGLPVTTGRSAVDSPQLWWKGATARRDVSVSAASMTMGQEAVEHMDPVQQRLMFDDECILVDEKDNVVGHDSKYNCHLMEKIEAENLLHRAFSVFLFNSKNELLLQKRSGTKVTFPLVWTNTCCSHPLYRDSELIKENHLGVRNAAQRKLFDELGIEAPDAPVDDFTCLGRILYKAASDGKWGEHELDYLVFMQRDVTVKPNPDEVADVMYVTREKLQELVKKAKAGEDGVKLSPWFQLVVENFLYDWWERLEEGTLSEVADMETIHKLL